VRFDVQAEIDELKLLAASSGLPPDFIRGAVWAFGRLTGESPLALERQITGDAPTPQSLPSLPAPSLPLVPEESEVLGVYPGLGPITKLPDALQTADMTQPPAPPDATAMSAMAAQVEDSPAHQPMSDEELADIEKAVAARPGARKRAASR
jgi:hypothetical protein